MSFTLRLALLERAKKLLILTLIEVAEEAGSAWFEYEVKVTDSPLTENSPFTYMLAAYAVAESPYLWPIVLHRISALHF